MSRGYDELKPEGGGYDTVEPAHGYVTMKEARRKESSSSKDKRTKPSESSASVSRKRRKVRGEGTTTFMLRLEASNISKVNLLMTTLAVFSTMYIICCALAALILLHHNRVVDWFPIVTEVTGEGWEIPEVPE
ncbi:unnamed protein product [Cylicocyclus nassatus]|uniref:Uncharacterized protein n=1 Tax=Cylicocyclus nassatus TaxID=53992 RepID=A0AA36GUC1_CYLNA|nr:unnamed protein product [Cylicocyclus nassatus]